jgi:nucleoside 2-deoxyribosyltransferase
MVCRRVPDLEGNTCFVAMSFDPTLTDIFVGPMSEGIRKAGYEPLRIDNKEHNNDVTDEILAGIRTSRFLLADFTLHRAGVYYEAGFAAGLGKPVVRTVRDDEKESIHFDTRQLNHIIWHKDALDDFAKKITARIVATIGQGPVPILPKAP